MVALGVSIYLIAPPAPKTKQPLKVYPLGTYSDATAASINSKVQKLHQQKEIYQKKIDKLENIYSEKYHSLRPLIRQEISLVPDKGLVTTYAKYYNSLDSNMKNFYYFRPVEFRGFIESKMMQENFKELYAKEPFYQYREIEDKLKKLESKVSFISQSKESESPEELKLRKEKSNKSFLELKDLYQKQISLLSKQSNR